MLQYSHDKNILAIYFYHLHERSYEREIEDDYRQTKYKG